MELRAVLSFARSQTVHFIISTFSTIFMLLILTDETLKFFNGLIILFKNYFDKPSIFILLCLFFGMTITFLIHKKYIKKKSSAFILSIFELSVQSLFMLIILLFFFTVTEKSIQIEQFFWYLLFLLIISFSIFDLICINQYVVKKPIHLKTIEEVLLKNTKNKNERTPQFMRSEGLLWSDFQAGLAINREETIEIIRTIKRDKYCTLIGHPASGKSILLRARITD